VSVTIGPLDRTHWDTVRAIFQEGIDDGDATFETSPPDWAGWDAGHLPDCRLVAVVEGEIGGWAALSAVSSRPAYAGVAEVSVYVARRHRGRGYGRRLLRALIEASEGVGLWTLQAVVFPQNTASLALHQREGFRVVGHRERIARLGNAWQDTVLLERRSRAVGT
jgi:phosphinothricin acetyltransferase